MMQVVRVTHSPGDDFHVTGLGNLQPSWSDPNHRRVIMAALVKGVYVMEKDRQAGFWDPRSNHWKQGYMSPPWWLSFQYDFENPIIDQRRNTVIGAVFRWRYQSWPEGPPQRVVAFRGTMLKGETKDGDIEVDIHIVFHQLHATHRYEVAVEIVRKLVECFGPMSLCLTGHSKGAALGLLVGRKLAEEGYSLEAHLYNAPCASLPTERMPRLSFANQIAHNVVAAGVASILKDKNTRELERAAFLAIRHWHPHLYLNSHDPICSSYIAYFGAQGYLQQLGGGLFSNLATPQSIRGIIRSYFGKNSKPDHLIPSAHVHINSMERDVRNAHFLQQWLNIHLHLRPLRITFNDTEDRMILDHPLSNVSDPLC